MGESVNYWLFVWFGYWFLWTVDVVCERERERKKCQCAKNWSEKIQEFYI